MSQSKLPSSGSSSASRAGTIREPKLLRRAYEAFEAATVVHRQCTEALTKAVEQAQWYRGYPALKDKCGVTRWRALDNHMQQIWTFLDQVVRTTRFDPREGQALYRLLLETRIEWAAVEAQVPASARLTQMTVCLRDLLIAHPHLSRSGARR